VCVAAIMRRSAYNIILLSETRPTRGPQKQYALSQHPRRRTPSAQRPTPWSITHIPPTPSLDSFCILRSPFSIRHSPSYILHSSLERVRRRRSRRNHGQGTWMEGRSHSVVACQRAGMCNGPFDPGQMIHGPRKAPLPVEWVAGRAINFDLLKSTTRL